MDADFSEFLALAADIESAPAETEPFLKKAIEVTSRSIKDDWRDGAKISRGYPKTYAAAISYDLEGLSSEIGPVLGATPGASAGFLEEGGGGVDGPPHHAGRNAVGANTEDFYQGIEKALADGLAKAVGAR